MRGVAAGFRIPQEAACRTRHESAYVGASHAHRNMWYAELRCVIKDSPADKVWEAYGRGGAHSCVRNAHTYGDDNVQGILSLSFLFRKS